MMRRQNSPPKLSQRVLPCFNLVATGTCAYGAKCSFLHDPRLMLSKENRKWTEFMLQHHLHIHRPNTKNSASAYDDLSCSCDHEYTCLAGKTINNNVGFARDSIFRFPFFEMYNGKSNNLLYDFDDDEVLEQHRREMCIWYHLIRELNHKKHLYTSKLCLQTPRLPLFRQLSGVSGDEPLSPIEVQDQLFRLKCIWLMQLDFSQEERRIMFFEHNEWSKRLVNQWTLVDIMRQAKLQGKMDQLLSRAFLLHNRSFSSWDAFLDAYEQMKNMYSFE